MDRARRRLRSPEALAETATAGVEYHLARSEPEIARELQPVGALAWAFVLEPSASSCSDLQQEMLRAGARLSRVCHATTARSFLEDGLTLLSEFSAEPGGPASQPRLDRDV